MVEAADGDEVERVRRALGVAEAFRMERTIAPPRWVNRAADRPLPSGRSVVAVAGIARPQRFFDDLVRAGWHVARELRFRDHHWYTDADFREMTRVVAETGAAAVLTTEKDAVRLVDRIPDDLPLAAVPLAVSIEPAGFLDWLLRRLVSAGAAGGARP
jgi:tetraacyldisaccharide-1-P 4'-kinase